MKQIICDMWQKAYQIKGKTDAQPYVLYVTLAIPISFFIYFSSPIIFVKNKLKKRMLIGS